MPKLSNTLFGPVKLMRRRYWPLLMIYFANGLSGFSAIALTFWQKEQLGLSAEQLLTISAWASIPWTTKIVFGQFVDSIKLFGSRRRIYILIGAVFLVLGTLLLAGLAGRHSWVMWIGGEYRIFLLSSLCTVIGFVLQDVTADTMTTEVVDREQLVDGVIIARPKEDVQAELASVQVLARIFIYLSTFMVAGLGGWLASQFEYESIFWCQLLIPLVSISGAMIVRLNPVPENEIKPLNPLILGGGVAFAFFSILIGMQDWEYGQELVFVVSGVLLCTLLGMLIKTLPKEVHKPLAFSLLAIFLYRCSPPVGPGLSWWSIDVLGFDEIFFGVLAQIGAFTGMAVLWLLSDFITRQALKKTMLIIIVIETCLFLPDLMLYHGIHEQLGVDARTIALFDSAAVSPLNNVAMVLMLSLIAFHAPAGNRGTWFALAASFMNLALTAAQLVSKYLNKLFPVSREVLNEAGGVEVAANYEMLGILLISCMAWTFLVPILAVGFLIRDSKPKETQSSSIQTATS